MKQILKRLELIKTAITIEDEEIIELQVIKIQSLKTDDEIQNILNLLSQLDYANVTREIENYITKYSGMVVFEDKEVQGLKLELKVLEKQFQKLTNEKSEYLHTVEEFNAQYNSRLGDLIQQILKEKQINNFKKWQKDKDKEELREKYEQAKQEHDDFADDYQEQIKEQPKELNDEDKKSLKQAYRKASKLCHPDVVDDEAKEKAEEVFKVLNDAYRKNDLETVDKILDDLKNGNSFDMSSDIVNDKEILKNKIQNLRTKIDTINNEIIDIKEEETFQTISNIEQWDEYFNSLEEQLNSELNKLKKIEPIKKEDNYWDEEF